MNVSTNGEKKSQLFSSTHISIFLFHCLLLILESDKDYNKTSPIKDIFSI